MGEMWVEIEATAKCPCGGVAKLGYVLTDDGERTPTALHELPYCITYRILDVAEYATYLRKSKEN